jgi:hypothetical protein
MGNQVYETFKTLNRHDQKRTCPPHTVVKMKSTKQQQQNILRATREFCQVTYRGKPMKIRADLSSKTLKDERTQTDVCETK